MGKIFKDNRLSCLYIIDGSELIEELKLHLAAQFQDYKIAKSGAEAEKICVIEQPHIILFGTNHLINSSEIYLDLMVKHKDLEFHRSILMVKAEDAAEAAKLCTDRVFNDYIIVKPLYDKEVFNSVIRRCIEVIAEHGSLEELSDVELELRNVQINGLENHKTETLLQNKTRTTQQQFKTEMSSDIDDFTGKVIHDLDDGKDAQHIKKSITNLSEKLHHSLERGDKDMNSALSEWEKLSAITQKQLNSGLSSAIKATKVQRTILIIEDDEFYLNVLAAGLETEGYCIKKTLTGKLGLEMINQIRPDLIILDWNLPDIMGSFVLKTIKSSIKFCHIPVIVLTGHSQVSIIKEAMALGASDFIVKPSDKKQMLNKIQQAIFGKSTTHAGPA
ncbi:response regulator [Thiomicrorhabdus arctica]|uniref:response regulator n=1 Tax=Thiomicrorhabdus arctica TaxID=131540 RepID=UPI00037F59B6|nr:response regulator [Thiomicrorhabdus arctica]